ncbi:hypothetical protein HDC89_000567 [Herbaspirillum sp. SJZ102]|nr:hypothetical protein [Herbaspirillum sp. SJZ102]
MRSNMMYEQLSWHCGLMPFYFMDVRSCDRSIRLRTEDPPEAGEGMPALSNMAAAKTLRGRIFPSIY